MSNPDPTKVLFSSRYGYFINVDDAVQGSVTIPSASRASGSITDFTITLPKSTNCRYSNAKVNYSTDTSGLWHIIANLRFQLDTYFQIIPRIAYLTNSIVVHVLLYNGDASSQTNTAVTVTARIRPQSVS